MPKFSRKTLVISLAVFGFLALLGLQLARELRGPTPAGGFERIFGEPPPDDIRDLKIKYYTHLKGNGIYLGLRAEPEQIRKILGFDPADANPMYIPEIDHHQHWQHENTFRELYPNDFPDLKSLRTRSVHLPDEIREFVISPDTGHVFCFRLLDSDIDL